VTSGHFGCCFSGLPGNLGFSMVAEKFRKFNIRGLLIIGGFEVRYLLCVTV